MQIEMSDEHWPLVVDLFDQLGHRQTCARTDRRRMVNASFWINQIGCQRRNLSRPLGPRVSVWPRWRRFGDDGAGPSAMESVTRHLRATRGSTPRSPISMLDWLRSSREDHITVIQLREMPPGLVGEWCPRPSPRDVDSHTAWPRVRLAIPPDTNLAS